MIDVLFVDDDADVLEGLQNRLYGLRDQFSSRYASSGEEALRAFEKARPDVVVTDMRMPGMDGAALLERVRQRYPSTVRIILSGETGRPGLISAIATAHQVLSKPCDIDDLRRAIDEALHLQRSFRDPQLVSLLGEVRLLPSPPRITQELGLLLQGESVSLQQVAELLRRDPALTARVLQIVNSAYFRRDNRVAELVDAVRILGLDLLRGVVLAEELYVDLAHHPHLAQDVGRVQRQAVLTAQVAQTLARDEAERRLLFTAAIVQDVGLLALMAAGADRNPDVDIDHGMLGAYLLSLWGLPHPLVRTVAFARQPARHGVGGLEAASLLHLASVIVLRRLARGAPVPWEMEPVLDQAWRRAAGLDATALRALERTALAPAVPA